MDTDGWLLMPDFDFVGDAYTANSIYQDDQELINWFVEDDPRKVAKSQLGPADRGDLTLYPTPGLFSRCQLAVAEIRALRPVSGGAILIAVAGSIVYSVSATFVPTIIGNLLSSAGPVSISDNGPQVYIVDGANRYTYQIATNIFATLPSSEGAFPGGDVVDMVDNIFVYNRPNTQQWAASDPLSTTTQALSFASKFGDSDNLISLIVDHREVWLLGSRTGEVWVNVGSFPFPFQIVPGTSMQHGCGAKFSLSRLGNSFAFIAMDTRGNGTVVKMNGYQAERISTSAVENDIQGGIVSDAIAFTYQVRGHELYVLTLPAQDKTWVYDDSTKFWHKWLAVDLQNIYHRHRSNCFAFFQGMSIVGDYENGKLYSLENEVYTDDGATIRRLRRCPHLVNDFLRVYHHDLQIQFQPGVGLDGIQQGTNPKAMLRWSNDGGSTWSGEHWVSIGKQGEYKNRAIWRQLGEARDRIYEVVITDPIKPVVVSANLNATAGAN
jgi:hypothetical protein